MQLIIYTLGRNRLKGLFRLFSEPGGDPSGVLALNYTYPAYDMLSDLSKDYCVGWTPTPCARDQHLKYFSSDAWVYTHSSDVWGIPFWAMIHTYNGGGYIANLDINPDVSLKIMQELWDHFWIDHQTRAVFLEFSVYNANTNLFSVVTIAFEYLESGGVIAYPSVYTLRVYLGEGATGVFTVICQIIFIILLVVMLIKEIKAVIELRLAYFKDLWHVVDLLIILISALAIAFYLMRLQFTNETIARMIETEGKKFVNFQHIALWDQYFIYCLGGLAFLATFKFLKLIRFNRSVSEVGNSIVVALPNLGNFFIVFGGIYMGFTTMYYMIFGRLVDYYATVVRTIESLFATLMGSNQLDELLTANPTWAVITYLLFVFFMVVLLTNMMLAIICHALIVASERTTRHDSYEAWLLLKLRMLRFGKHQARVWFPEITDRVAPIKNAKSKRTKTNTQGTGRDQGNRNTNGSDKNIPDQQPEIPYSEPLVALKDEMTHL